MNARAEDEWSCAMSNVIPLDSKKHIEAALRPASPGDAQAAVAVLAKALPILPSIQDPPAFRTIMADFLRPYPADVLIAFSLGGRGTP